LPFSLPKLPFVSDLFAQLGKVKAKFSEPRLFDLLFVALVIFSFSVALCAMGAMASGIIKPIGFCTGFALIVTDALFLCGVYLWLLLKGQATTATELDTESGLRAAKAQHLVAKRKVAKALASAPSLGSAVVI
jgi:hypothetical protein